MFHVDFEWTGYLVNALESTRVDAEGGNFRDFRYLSPAPLFISFFTPYMICNLAVILSIYAVSGHQVDSKRTPSQSLFLGFSDCSRASAACFLDSRVAWP